jgi:hypothetical protein
MTPDDHQSEVYRSLEKINAKSKWHISTAKWSRGKEERGKLCSDGTTELQKQANDPASDTLAFHMIMRKGTDCAGIDKGLKFASLGQEWDDLYDSIPKMKYTRTITAEK